MQVLEFYNLSQQMPNTQNDAKGSLQSSNQPLYIDRVPNAKLQPFQSFINKSKRTKAGSMGSFESKMDEVKVYDSYIATQHYKMKQQKAQNPTLMIPNGFKSFIESAMFKSMLQKIDEYMLMLIEFTQKYQILNMQQKKQENLESHAERYSPSIQKMRYESHLLEEKCKEISYGYMGILLSQSSCKQIFKDQYFFETMIYFLGQVLRSLSHFEEEHYPLIEEELNRFFRTDAFNLIKRRNLEDEYYQKYPALKESTGGKHSSRYDSSMPAVNRMMKRIALQKRLFNYSLQMKPGRSVSVGQVGSKKDILEDLGAPLEEKISTGRSKLRKPMQIELSSFGSVNSRSPLISSFYPGQKEKAHHFGKLTREKDTFVKKHSNQSPNETKQLFFPDARQRSRIRSSFLSRLSERQIEP